MKSKDDIFKRFLFIPRIIIVVSVLCIIYNVVAPYVSTLLMPVSTFDNEVEEVDHLKESSGNYERVEKITVGEDPIDINTATKEELMRLPGIGSGKAEEIVEIRERMQGFRTIGDLKNTAGIGAKTFEKLEKFITISEYTKK